MMNDAGQIGIDFLLGISLFLLALGFAIQFIPGLFASSSGEDESLGYVAYRTASILTEDPGWWENDIHNGTNWENHTGDLKRIGLSEDKTVNTRLTETPNIINKSKISKMMQLSKNEFITKLGLYENVQNHHFNYGYNISIKQNDKILKLNNISLTRGKSSPDYGEVFKIKRIVLLKTDNSAKFNVEDLTANWSKSKSKAIISVSGPKSEDLTLYITNFNDSAPKPEFQDAALDGIEINRSSDYYAYKKTNASTFTNYSDSLNNTDILQLDFNNNLFPNNESYQLELNFSNVNFTDGYPIEYEKNIKGLYEPASLIVKVWQ